eukprot:6689874-Pyramimonas_sp.AAC.1
MTRARRRRARKGAEGGGEAEEQWGRREGKNGRGRRGRMQSGKGTAPTYFFSLSYVPPVSPLDPRDVGCLHRRRLYLSSRSLLPSLTSSPSPA